MGRTGTFIVIDAMVDMMHAEQKVDVFEFVSRIRNQRPQMVQTDVSGAPRWLHGADPAACVRPGVGWGAVPGRGCPSSVTMGCQGTFTQGRKQSP